MTTILSELGHFAPLVPLVLYFGLRNRQDLPPEFGMVAVALAFSFAGDTIGASLASKGLDSHWVTYLVAPLQFGLLAAVVLKPGPMAWTVVGTILAAGVILGFTASTTRPELLIQAIGGIWVGGIARWGYQGPGSRAIWSYCLIPLPFVVWMGVIPPTDPVWMPGWVAYQLIRIGVLAAFGWEVCRYGRYRRTTRRMGSGEGGRHLRLVALAGVDPTSRTEAPRRAARG